MPQWSTGTMEVGSLLHLRGTKEPAPLSVPPAEAEVPACVLQGTVFCGAWPEWNSYRLMPSALRGSPFPVPGPESRLLLGSPQSAPNILCCCFLCPQGWDLRHKQNPQCCPWGPRVVFSPLFRVFLCLFFT